MKYLIHGHCTRTNLPGDPINHVNLLYNSFLLVLTKATLGWYLNTTLYGTVVHVKTLKTSVNKQQGHVFDHMVCCCLHKENKKIKETSLA